MKIGYNKPLYILPFDHRSSFEKGFLVGPELYRLVQSASLFWRRAQCPTCSFLHTCDGQFL
jgi:hypothetical protein